MLEPLSVTYAAWAVLGVTWLVGSLRGKRVTYRQPSLQQALHMVPMTAGYLLLVAPNGVVPFLSQPIFPAATAPLGAVVCLAGVALAIWARVILGGNWSGAVTLKRGHELVTSGPYHLVRHPIYSGLLLGAVGTGLAGGELRTLPGLLLIVWAMARKIPQEEALMQNHFPAAYPAYRAQVKRLIPYIY